MEKKETNPALEFQGICSSPPHHSLEQGGGMTTLRGKIKKGHRNLLTRNESDCKNEIKALK